MKGESFCLFFFLLSGVGLLTVLLSQIKLPSECNCVGKYYQHIKLSLSCFNPKIAPALSAQGIVLAVPRLDGTREYTNSARCLPM